MSKFYVYELWDSLKNEPFYVGKGKVTKSVLKYTRPYDHIKIALGLKKNKDNNRHKLGRISKIIRNGGKINIKIVFESAIEEDTLKKEIELIRVYGRRDLRTGSLTNLTDGGDGVGTGRIFTIADRKRISNRVRGCGNPMYGKTHSAISRSLISAGHKGKPGYKHSAKWRDKLRLYCPGGIAVSKKIYQIDLNGNVVKEWNSIRKAACYMGTSSGNVHIAIKNYITCKDFFWTYINDPMIVNNKLINVEELNYKRLRPKNVKRVAQLNADGTKIKEWDSQLEIKRNLGFNSDVISNIITGRRKSNEYMGYKWELA
jgi:hypothetical protein